MGFTLNVGELEIDIKKTIEQLTIVNKNGVSQKLILNKPQTRLLESMADDWNNGRPLRYIILKARQMGFSTLIEAFIFVVTMFQTNKKAVIVADCAENASSLFDMSQQYYDVLNDECPNLLPRTQHKTGKLIATANTKSSIRILCASENTGRGKSLQFLHLSEFAFWDDPEKAMTALLRTVSASNPKSAVFIESTANGMNAFKSRCDTARAGDSPYKFFFFPWFEMDEYRLPYSGFTLTPEEEEIKTKFKLDNDQLEWRRYQIKDMEGDMNSFHQEYPATPEEAFIATGYSVFDNAQVSKRKEEVAKMMSVKASRRGFYTYKADYSRDGSRIKISDIKWVDSPTGEILIHQNPLPGFPYCLGGDPADGGADAFAASVTNNVNKVQVATYSKPGIDADLYALQLYCLGSFFNWALIGTEVNRTRSVMKTLRKTGYPNLYVREAEDNIDEDYGNAWGVNTTTVTKPQMVDLYKAIFRENPQVINDFKTLCEMETFVVLDTPSHRGITTGAASSMLHDDMVMATAIAYFISDQQTTLVDHKDNPETVDNWVKKTLEKDFQKKARNRSWI